MIAPLSRLGVGLDPLTQGLKFSAINAQKSSRAFPGARRHHTPALFDWGRACLARGFEQRPAALMQDGTGSGKYLVC